MNRYEEINARLDELVRKNQQSLKTCTQRQLQAACDHKLDKSRLLQRIAAIEETVTKMKKVQLTPISINQLFHIYTKRESVKAHLEVIEGRLRHTTECARAMNSFLTKRIQAETLSLLEERNAIENGIPYNTVDQDEEDVSDCDVSFEQQEHEDDSGDQAEPEDEDDEWSIEEEYEVPNLRPRMVGTKTTKVNRGKILAVFNTNNKFSDKLPRAIIKQVLHSHSKPKYKTCRF